MAAEPCLLIMLTSAPRRTQNCIRSVSLLIIPLISSSWNKETRVLSSPRNEGLKNIISVSSGNYSLFCGSRQWKFQFWNYNLRPKLKKNILNIQATKIIYIQHHFLLMQLVAESLYISMSVFYDKCQRCILLAELLLPSLWPCKCM